MLNRVIVRDNYNFRVACVNTAVAKETSGKFSKINRLFTVQTFGGWDAVQKKFFNDGAIFDQIQRTGR